VRWGRRPYIPPILRGAHLCIPLAALLITGCGETKIDGPKAERLIRDLVTEQVGARVATVTCPTGITASKGVRFNCAVTAADGTKGNVLVTGRDGKGSVDLSAPFLTVREAEADMARQIGEQSDATVQVECPELIVIRKGVTFLCKATADGQERDVTGRFLDDSGRFSFRPN
jgi:hypothetical protein